MEKQEAARILCCLVEGNKRLAEAAELVEKLSDKEEAESLRKTIACAVGRIAGDAFAPII